MATNLKVSEMSLVGHLSELRSRLIICILALVFSVGISLFFAPWALNIMTHPIKGLAMEQGRIKTLEILVKPGDGSWRFKEPLPTPETLKLFSQKRLIFTFLPDPSNSMTTVTMPYGEDATQQFYYSSPIDPIMIQIKVALILGILIALPVLLWQIWLFIRPGLKKKERTVVKWLLGGAVFLFPIGAGFAYFVVVLVLKIVQVYQIKNVAPLLSIYSYLSLMFKMMMVFGCIFEMPLIVAIAARIGLIKPHFLQSYRRHAYVALAFVAMLVAPTADPFTMLVIMFPLIALYEISVLLCVIMAHMRKQAEDQGDETEEAEEKEEEEEDSTI